MSELRNAIAEGALPTYVRTFLREFFPLATPAPCDHCPPRWVKNALDSVGIPTDDMFDWSEGAKELPDMPHHRSKDKGEDYQSYLPDHLREGAPAEAAGGYKEAPPPVSANEAAEKINEVAPAAEHAEETQEANEEEAKEE